MKRNVPKPRNPFVQHLMLKRSAVHGKSKKAQRRQDKVMLKNQDVKTAA